MLDDQIILQMPPDLQMTEEQFFEFCQINRDLPKNCGYAPPLLRG
ncbi:hypothetical protein [Okeania sp. SIO2C9]|nr:hypothetical protein [Okeania sp. SIO2C9]